MYVRSINKKSSILHHLWHFTASEKAAISGEQIHAYDNTAFSGSHEMEERKPDAKSDVERLGYEMYNGKSEKR